jgi:short-subunit dehydrogenase
MVSESDKIIPSNKKVANLKNIVITGSTRGIGFGLAREFLKQGCSVTISGRKQADVDAAVKKLSGFTSSPLIQGITCDVSSPAQVQALWEIARLTYGKVDIWINNAGISHQQLPYWELAPEEVTKIISTNITGLMNGCTTAVNGMRQQGYGAIYNMEGLGSNGMKIKGLSVYGTTKAAVKYFSEALRKDLEGLTILIGEILPGMVVTDMITGQHGGDSEGWKKNRKVYNILANREETVTPWLVQKMLSNTRTNAKLKYVSTLRLISQLLAAVFFKRDLFQQDSK